MGMTIQEIVAKLGEVTPKVESALKVLNAAEAAAAKAQADYKAVIQGVHELKAQLDTAFHEQLKG